MTSKSKLNLFCQKTHTAIPCYSTERLSEGFVSTVTVAETPHKSQRAHSTKKAAEDDAASTAIQFIVQSHPGVANIDQLIDSLTTSKKRRSRQQPATPPPPLLGSTSGQVGPSGQLPPPGMTAGLVPNHSQPHLSAPAPKMPPLHTQPPPASVLNPPIQPIHIPIHQERTYLDDSVRHIGRPASAIPANPYHNHGGPARMVSSSPTEQNVLSVKTESGPQNSVFSIRSPSLHPPIPKPQEALEALCRQRGLSPPNYHIAQNVRGYYSAKVALGGSELSTMREYDDFDTAKESATALAVIELGLQALTLSNAGDLQQAPIQQQVLQSSQQQSISPPVLTNTLDQTPLAAASIHTTSSVPLHPPSFFHTPSLLTGHPPQQPPSQPPDHPPCLSPPNTEDPRPTPVSVTQPTTSLAVPIQSRGGTPQRANMTLPPGDYKQMLNLYCQKKHIPLPSYSCEFPEDSVGYISSVTVAGMTFSSPPQGSKRLAEAIAAAEAVNAMGIAQGDDKQQQPSSGTGTAGGPVPQAHQTAVPLSLSGAGGAVSFKNLLQEYTHKSKLSLPHYETERTEEGFKSTVSIYTSGKSMTFTSAAYPVKKAAEQEAAKIACTELNLLAP